MAMGRNELKELRRQAERAILLASNTEDAVKALAKATLYQTEAITTELDGLRLTIERQVGHRLGDCICPDAGNPEGVRRASQTAGSALRVGPARDARCFTGSRGWRGRSGGWSGATTLRTG